MCLFVSKRAKRFTFLFRNDHSEATKIVAEFKEIFESDAEKVGQNLKYDLEVLKRYGITVNGFLYDTMIAHYLLHPDMKHNMDDMSEYYLNYKPVSI